MSTDLGRPGDTFAVAIICWDNRNFLQRISLDNRNDIF